MIPRPLGVRILVKVLGEDDTAGPVIWTPNPTTSCLRGAVVEIGEEVRYLHSGDEVLFANETAIEFEYEREHYFLMPEGCVLALLDRLGAVSS